ncbi:RNA 2',3'-cyclic phosphodiesterase [Motiliproteus coralliicola]|uniref:RNA 2',3'-cyclic phosphodiesterase n=1 Tax=Motiliproteus coralliicola TaxID=2283196 RepID=A0A369WLE3_9GAMM|nr:RNA 2',3'-cyclic phosphodiesterase [Motiliproteus coralliicola]RDE22522.1 RNA 2',3'-cyclic phosphodiesterase [Motiliproteus coralliicola]
MSIRSFFAIPLKLGSVRRLADHADSLGALGLQADRQGLLRWSDSDSFHLTLCFLGDISLEQVAALEQRAREALQGQGSFQVQLQGSDYLQVNPELTVLAVLAQADEQLLALQQCMAQVVEQVGLFVDEPDFRPHITLARLKGSDSLDPPPSWPQFEMPLLADSVVLFQSLPGEHGSIYTPLFEVPLTAPLHHDTSVELSEQL